MPAHDPSPDGQTGAFHELVANGTFEELAVALKKDAAVNAPGHIGRTALMVAIDARDIDKLKLLLDHGADPELTDDFNNTALRQAVHADFVEGVMLLLSLGVDRGHQPKYPLKEVRYDFDFPIPLTELPEELRNLMSEAEWAESLRETRDSLAESGKNPTVEPIISDVQSVPVLRLFLEAGDDLELAPLEVKRELVGLPAEAAFQSSVSDYQEQMSRRFGTSNPERMDHAFWRDMIRTGGNAYSARTHFEDTEFRGHSTPVWCYDRFGSSLTPLPDGRYVQIAGEHEDYYDPDFCIYNDVVVHDGHGGFEIFGYPEAVFPPTDFHSATLVGDQIYLIGSLGYSEQRQAGFTPVYRLRLESWDIEAVDTFGDPPGWVHRHRARHDPERNVIVITNGLVHQLDADHRPALVPNEGQFELDLQSFRWRRTG